MINTLKKFIQYYTTLKNIPKTRTYTRRLSEDDLPRGPAVPRTGDPPLQTIIRANRRLPKREPLISPVPPPRLAAWHRCQHHSSYHDDDDGNNRWRAHCPLPLDSCHPQNALIRETCAPWRSNYFAGGVSTPSKYGSTWLFFTGFDQLSTIRMPCDFRVTCHVTTYVILCDFRNVTTCYMIYKNALMRWCYVIWIIPVNHWYPVNIKIRPIRVGLSITSNQHHHNMPSLQSRESTYY